MAEFKWEQPKFTKETVEGVVTLKVDNEAFYKDAIKANELTLKEFETVESFNKAYLAAMAEKFADEATTAFKKDKNLHKIHFEAPFTTAKSGSIEAKFDREKTYKIPGTDNEITKPAMQVIVTDPYKHVSKSSIKRMTDEIAEALRK